MPYDLRAAENADQKQAIGTVVAGLVADDSSVVLDNGSTMVAVARELRGHSLTALCLSLRSAFELGDAGGITVITPGGTVAAESLRYDVGACLQAVDEFSADVAVLGACAAHPAKGLTVTTQQDARVKRAVIATSARTILAATGDKLARNSSFRFGHLEDIDDLVTTADAPEATLEAFAAVGTRVHLAPE